MGNVAVIGGGHNGLVAATRLAKAGRQVTLFETRDQLGGISGLLPTTAQFAPHIDKELGLGLQWTQAPAIWGCREDGTAFSLHQDAGWRSWTDFCQRYRATARGLLTRPAPTLRTAAPTWPIAKAAIDMRRLGERDLMELLRVAPQCADDALAEHISDPAVRAVAAGCGLLGTWMGPLSPTGAAVLVLDRVLGGQEVVGGASALVAALEKAALGAGVAIERSARVRRVRIQGSRATGLVLDGDRAIDAELVVATCDPRTALLDLVRPQDLPVRVEYQAQEHRVRGLVAVVELTLSSAPRVGGQPVECLHTAKHPHDLERAFDGGKNRKLADRLPVLLRYDPSSGRALAWVHGVSQNPRGVAEGGLEDAVLERVVADLLRVWPGAADAIQASAVHTPDRIERDHGLAGGHLWHGELALDQLWSQRPGLDLSGHHTPIPGLWIAGAGSHPTGGITGLPGWLAAGAILGTS